MRKHGYQALKADGGALVKPSREIKSRKCRPQNSFGMGEIRSKRYGDIEKIQRKP